MQFASRCRLLFDRPVTVTAPGVWEPASNGALVGRRVRTMTWARWQAHERGRVTDWPAARRSDHGWIGRSRGDRDTDTPGASDVLRVAGLRRPRSPRRTGGLRGCAVGSGRDHP